MGYEFFSAATSGTSMDIDKARDYEETKDLLPERVRFRNLVLILSVELSVD